MKNVIFKRMLTLLLCLCMVLSYVPATVFAAETQVTDLEIGGVTVVEDGEVKTASGTGWTYSSGGVLTLKYASISEVYAAGGSLTVNVLGNSNIVAASGYDPFYADNCDVTFDVAEGKTLTITCTKGQSAVYLHDSDVYFTGKGEVTLKGSGVTGAIDGIGDIYIDGVTMTMKNSSATASSRYVIGHGKNVYIGETSAANVTVTSHSDDTGAFGESTVSVKNGSVLTVNAPSGYGFGGTGGAALKVSGSTVTVTADNGVFGSGTLTLMENSLVAKGSTSADGSNAAFYNQSSHWDYKYLNVHPGYAITIDGNIQGATVAASTTAADAGDSVTLTVTPKTARTLTSLTVGGNEVLASVQENQNGTYTYTFTMPSRDVAVSAALKVDPEKCPHEMYVDGACADCGTACGHNYVDGICQSCAALAAVKVTAAGTTTWYEDMDAANAYIAKQTGSAQVMLISNAAIKGDSSKEFSFAPNTVTLDLNGKTLTAAGNVYYPEGSNVTVTDTNPDGGGAFIIRGSIHKINTGGALTLEKGAIQRVEGAFQGLRVSGTFTMHGGSIKGYSAGVVAESGGDVIVTGGTLEGGSSVGLSVAPGGDADLTGGTYISGISIQGTTVLKLLNLVVSGYQLRTQDDNVVNLSSTYVGETCYVVCGHDAWTEGVCDTCDMVCPHETYSGGACTLCKEICSHEEFGADNKCTECGMAAAATVTVGSSTTYYLNMTKAMEAIPTDGTESTLTLLRDYNGFIRIAEGMNVVLSGGDYGIKPTNGDAISVSGGTLKVVSGTVKGNNGIYVTSGDVTVTGGTVQGATCGIYNLGTGRVSVEGGTVKSTSLYVCAICNDYTGTVSVSGGAVENPRCGIYNNSTGGVTVSGGIVKTTDSIGNGIYNYSTGSVTVKGNAQVETEGSSSYGIYNNGGGTVNVEGGKITSGYYGIENYSGILNVSGGEIIGNDYGVNNNGTLNIRGGSVTGTTSHGIYNTGGIEMTGGSVTGGSGSDGIYIERTNGKTVEISGGTVSGGRNGLNNAGGSTLIFLSGGTFLRGYSTPTTGQSPQWWLITGCSFVYLESGAPYTYYAKLVTDNLKVVCSHKTWTEGVCNACGTVCPHESYSDGVCTNCGESCDHAGGVNENTGICVDGCGSFAAKVVVWDQMIDDNLHYFEGIDAANEFELSESNSTLCLKLLEDVTAQGTSGIFYFAGKSIQLDLNGHTLTAPALQYSDNAVVKVMDTSEDGKGKISTTSHLIKSGARLTLESGTLDHAIIVQGTLLVEGGNVDGTVTVKENGSLTVNDGIISSANYGIIAETDTASITVTGGTISGGGDANALYNRGNSGNIALSGGVFLGGIWACDNTLADTDTPEYLLKDLLAEGYGYAAYDTANGVGEAFTGTDFRSVDNLTVVCAHKNIGYAGEGDLATAYCRNENCHLPANTVLGTLQVVAEDAVYDGEPHGASVQTTGILKNIATRLVYQDVSSGETLNGPPSKVGTYSVICYSDAWSSPSAEYKITAATPVYSWNTPVQTRTYTGKTAEIEAPVFTRQEGGDTFGGTFTYAYTGITAGGEAVSGQGLPTNAGEYTVTASAEAWGSYAAAEVPGAMTLTIEKAPLTVTAKALGRCVYGGTGPSHTVSYSDFVMGEDASVLEGTLTVFCDYDVTDSEKRNAGQYDIIPGGVTSDNYEIEFKKGILTVEPLEVTVRIDDQSVEYGEFGVMPHQYTFTLQEALPYGDTIEDVQPIISVTSDYTQGMAANQTLELKADSFRDNSGNYTLKKVLPGELTVTPRKVRAVMTGSVTKAYDGTDAVPENNEITLALTNTLSGDDVFVTAELTYGKKTPGTGITVHAKALKLTGTDFENYQLMNTSLSGSLGEITKAPLTVKAAAQGQIFYGGAAPDYTVSYSGFAPGEDASVLDGELTVSCDYDPARAGKRNAGSYAIIPGGLTSDNYAITFVRGTLQVKPLPVTVRINNKTVTYGDTGAGQHSFTLLETLPYGESLEAVKASISVSSGYVQGAAAGTQFDLKANVFSDGSGNYQLTKVLPGKLTVIPRKVSVSLGGSVTKVYDGTATVPEKNDLKLTLTNILENDVVSATGSFGYGQKNVGEKITVTAENIKLTGTHAGNYTLTDTTASAKVGKITKATPVLGKVTAKELADTTDISKVVITAEGGIPGTFSVKPGQTLKEGDNSVSYTFTPKDGANYQTVTGTVTVTVKKTVCDGGKNCPLQRFTDVTSSHWAHHGMDFAINTGLMKGTGTGKTFEPNTNMSRAMLVTVLWRYSGAPDAPDCSFTDVETDDWFYEAVAWAASEGVVKGMGDGSWFDPNGDVTREMLATILCRYADMIGVDTSARASIASFPDEEKVSGWSYNYMKWAVAEGIISGAVKDGKTVLAPQDSANRAVVATIMMRFIQSFES